jgi:hypothetical protein
VLHDRDRLVRDLLARTRDWIAEQDSEIETESSFLSPGDPDDDWDYDYNISLKRGLEHSRKTAAALEREHAAIEGEQQHWRRDR